MNLIFANISSLVAKNPLEVLELDEQLKTNLRQKAVSLKIVDKFDFSKSIFFDSGAFSTILP